MGIVVTSSDSAAPQHNSLPLSQPVIEASAKLWPVVCLKGFKAKTSSLLGPGYELVTDTLVEERMDFGISPATVEINERVNVAAVATQIYQMHCVGL